MEGLIEDSERLAFQFVGETVGQKIILPEAETVESLIASRKADVLEAQLEKLKRRVNPKHYEQWLEHKGFTAYAGQADTAEQITFVEEFIAESNSRGHGLEVVLSYGHSADAVVISDALSLGAGWLYQFSSRLTLGVSATLGAAYTRFFWAGAPPPEIQMVAVYGGPVIALGDKTDGLALLLSVGAGLVGEVVSVPVRASVYYRGWCASYTAALSIFDWGELVHFFGLGRTFFFGQKRRWKPA